MATQTPRLHLVKPAGNDYYNINDFNGNADILDTAIGGIEDALEGLTPKDIGAQPQIQLGSITFSVDWTGEESPFSQVCTVTGATVTANSKVDLQADDETEAQMKEDGCKKLYVVNNVGVLTAYAVGAALSVGVTVQCTVMEVV